MSSVLVTDYRYWLSLNLYIFSNLAEGGSRLSKVTSSGSFRID